MNYVVALLSLILSLAYSPARGEVTLAATQCRLTEPETPARTIQRFQVVQVAEDRARGGTGLRLVFERAPWGHEQRRYRVVENRTRAGTSFPHLLAESLGQDRGHAFFLLELETPVRKLLRAEGTIRVGDQFRPRQFGKFREYSFNCDQFLPIGL